MRHSNNKDPNEDSNVKYVCKTEELQLEVAL